MPVATAASTKGAVSVSRPPSNFPRTFPVAESMVCDKCGAEPDEDLRQTPDKKTLCEVCLARATVRCYSCSRPTYAPTSLKPTGQGSYFCDYCVATDYKGHRVPSMSLTIALGKSYCPECIKAVAILRCASCCSWKPKEHFSKHHDSNTPIIPGSSPICNDCGELCGSCKRWSYRHYMRYVRPFFSKSSSDIRMCHNCAERMAPAHPHNYRPTHAKGKGLPKNIDGVDFMDPVASYGFLTSPRDKQDHLFLGVELEVEMKGGRESAVSRGDVANEFRSRVPGFFCTKEDGSLSYGIEVVTAPATFDVHKEKWTAFFDAQEKDALPILGETTTTAGMHVHVAREAITYGQLGRMLTFVNAPINHYLIETVAGRNTSHWASFDAGADKITCFKKMRPGRYTAINTIPEHTVEFRIFRSAVTRANFFKNLEFVHALVKHCAPGRLSIRQTTDQERFFEFVRENRKVYPYLFDFLKAKGYFTKAA